MKTQSASDEKKIARLFQIFERHQKLFPGFLLFALVWMAFAPALQNNFITFDDPDYVTANYHVQQGLTWQSFKWAFTTTMQANWHPLTWISHMLDCEIFGLQPWGHHLTNILLHEADTILLFLVFLKMTNALWRSFFVAALFGVHPLHVESVAWISERKDVLSTLFWILAMWSYAKFAEEIKLPNGRAKVFYALTSAFFILGLMSKPMLVTLPFAFLLLDFWPLQRCNRNFQVVEKRDINVAITNFKSLLIEKIPFFILSAIASVVTYLAQKQGGSVVSLDVLPFGGRVENALVCYVLYLEKIFWPENLSIAYPPEQWLLAVVLGASLILVVVTILVFAMNRRRYLLMGWLWFVGTLVPAIGLVQSGWISMADRYSYVSAIGIFIMLAWGIWDFVKAQPAGKTISAVAIAAAILICIPLTRRQVGYWADGETLFRHALAVTPDNYAAHYELALALDNKGKFDEGVQQLQTALHLSPNNARIYNNLGFALDKSGHADEAIYAYQKALQLEPNYAEAHANLGIALSEKGGTDEAVRQLQEALKLNPDSPDIHYNLGNVYVRNGRLDDGIAQYQDAIKLNPGDEDAQNNLGVAYSRANRLDEATRQFLTAINLDPDDAAAHNNLGIVLYRKGLLAEAIAEYQKALQLNPDYAEAKKNLDMAVKKQTELRSKY